MKGLLLLEVRHRLSSCLDNDEIDTLSHFITLGIKHVTIYIVTDVSFQIGIHPDFWNRCKKVNGLFDLID